MNKDLEKLEATIEAAYVKWQDKGRPGFFPLESLKSTYHAAFLDGAEYMLKKLQGKEP